MRNRRIFKEGMRLKKILEPRSEFHRMRDAAQLKAVIIELKSLSDELPVGVAEQWKPDLYTACKYIVEDHKPLKERKPSLVVEDDLLF